jgi:hypothetical protein
MQSAKLGFIVLLPDNIFVGRGHDPADPVEFFERKRLLQTARIAQKTNIS